MREGDTLYWLLTDHLGSTAVTTWSGGSRSAEVRYMPFGLERYKAGSQKTDYRFTGQRIEDSLDLYFYNARWYDPVVGRFIQADTVVPEAGNPQSLNRYAYVNNNPLRYTDPSGHWLETVWDIVNIGWDIHEVYRDPGNGWNWVALAVDVGAAALPAVPAGAGLVVRGGKAAKAAAELASHADEVADVARVVAEAASHADKAVDALRAVGQVVGEAADVLRGVENATEAVRETSSLPRRFSRFMSRSELEAVKETGLLRGGRPGDTYFTTNKYRTVRSAEEKLALPRAPEVRLDFEMVNQREFMALVQLHQLLESLGVE